VTGKISDLEKSELASSPEGLLSKTQRNLITGNVDEFKQKPEE